MVDRHRAYCDQTCIRSGTDEGLLTWVPGEVGLQAALCPAEVLDEPLLAQRRQHGARALPNVGVCQQTVSGFAVGFSKLIVVLRDKALIAGEETETERSLPRPVPEDWREGRRAAGRAGPGTQHRIGGHRDTRAACLYLANSQCPSFSTNCRTESCDW